MKNQTLATYGAGGFACDPTALYSCDNGAILCGQHLGVTAKVTGRDLSGQTVMKIGTEFTAAWVDAIGRLPACETCGHSNPQPVARPRAITRTRNAVHKADVEIGGVYLAKVSGNVARVRITGESLYGGWNATNLDTKRSVRIRSAARLRKEVSCG